MNDEPDKSGTELITSGALPALVRAPQPSDKPHPALIMIHGRGANEGDIYELVPFVDKRVLIVAPRGPNRMSDDPRGSYSWYEWSSAGVLSPGVLDISLAGVSGLLDQLEEVGGVPVDKSQVYIGGFSQGAVMSLLVAAHQPDKLAGILPHSGVMTAPAAERFRAGAFRGKPAFVAHGLEDQILKVGLGQEIKAVLEESGVDVTYREYPIGHSTSPASRQDLGNWLNARLRF